MSLRERINGLVLAVLVGGSLGWTAGVYGEGSYPADYKPSKPAEKGDTNALARVLAVSTYMRRGHKSRCAQKGFDANPHRVVMLVLIEQG